MIVVFFPKGHCELNLNFFLLDLLLFLLFFPLNFLVDIVAGKDFRLDLSNL